MKKSVNDILKESFLKAFDNARKQREAEEKQKPFAYVGKSKLVVCVN